MDADLFRGLGESTMKELMRTTSKSSESSPPHFDCLHTQIDKMPYNEVRRLAVGRHNQTSDEFHACLAARDYLREDPERFEKQRQSEALRRKVTK